MERLEQSSIAFELGPDHVKRFVAEVHEISSVRPAEHTHSRLSGMGTCL